MNHQARGFSLIELLMVLSIVAGIVGLVSWNVHSVMLEHRLESAFDDLAIEIKAAQAEAVLAGREILIRYDMAQNIVSVEIPPEFEISEYLDQTKEERRRTYEQEKREVLRDFKLDSVIDLKAVYVDGKIHNNDSVLIFFGPDGTAEPHRILIEMTSLKQSVALEMKGLIGEVNEIDPNHFESEWDDEDVNPIPSIIEDEKFFDQGYPEKKPAQSEGSGE